MSETKFREQLEHTRSLVANTERQNTIKEHVAKRTLNAIKATWSVEKKNITDLILKKTRDLTVTARKHWIRTGMLLNETIRASAVEDEDVHARRSKYKKGVSDMNLVIVEVEKLEL